LAQEVVAQSPCPGPSKGSRTCFCFSSFAAMRGSSAVIWVLLCAWPEDLNIAFAASTTKTTTRTRTQTTRTTTAITTGPAVPINNSFLNPGGSAYCPSKCRYYFAGASNASSTVCQKQSSGTGLAEQNEKFGVSCFPAYGCGIDMITCINQEWKGPMPKEKAVGEACAGLDSIVAEDPWTCGSIAEGRTPCKQPQGNNAVGLWLKATADLGCGWGSTYGNVHPGYSGDPRPATSIYDGISTDYACCMKAMELETAKWKDGGAALFFQRIGRTCRVDRESIVYANMDSSSGRSVKYQNTRCGSNPFYYRHAAGASDAANLQTGGRCVLEGGFKKAPLSSGLNLPKGELPQGEELPNHACDPSTPNHQGCAAMLMFNTINDAEKCCEMCSTLSWLAPNMPNKGGNADRDPQTGLHTNPCVAWQIVNGRCRITRKAYMDHYSPTWTVLQHITNENYGSPGNTDWVIPHRGCGDSMERCNYYSSIYYREMGTPAAAQNKSATFRKIVTQEIDAGIKTINIDLSASSVPSRKDMRLDMVNDGNETVRAKNGTLSAGKSVIGENLGGSDCGRIEIYDAELALTKNGDYDTFDEEKMHTPMCVSPCITSGMLSIDCNITAANLTGRRLAGGKTNLALSFTSVGSGYDQVNFAASIAVTKKLATSTTTTTTTTPKPTTAPTSTKPTTVAPTTAAITASPTTATVTAAATTASPTSAKVTAAATTTTTTAGVQTKLKITGGLKIAVANTTAFTNDKVAHEGVKEGIGEAFSIEGLKVAASSVELEITVASRRLAEKAESPRRLAGNVQIAYEITIPTPSTELLAAMNNAATGTDFGAKLTKSIETQVKAKKGDAYDISVTEIDTPKLVQVSETTAVTKTTTTSLAATHVLATAVLGLIASVVYF